MSYTYLLLKMRSRNKYQLPIREGEFRKIDRTSSPAHVGKLRNSVDFVCDEGTPVYASLAGEVVWVKSDSNIGGPDRKYWNDGNRIVIRHENGEYSAYEHLRYGGVEVHVGELVKTGQLIGYSGNTGYTMGPHLHFEVFYFTGPNREEDFDTLRVEFQDYKEY